jgi:predicted ribosome quality control (RQC) complex YloA/Tae2 family protein
MQNNYYFLSKLSLTLAQRFGVSWQLGYDEKKILLNEKKTPFQLRTAFSQDKDELVLGFANDSEELYCKAILDNHFNCLTFPEDFARAKRNSADLFKEIWHIDIIGITQYLNERSFSIQFERGYTLLFKMYGRFSNIILFQDEKFVIAFHKKMGNDQTLQLSELDKEIEQSYAHFQAENGDWQKLFPTFGKEINEYLKAQHIESKPIEKRWLLIQQTLEDLEKGVFYIWNQATAPVFSLLPPLTEKISFKKIDEPIQAVNEFYYAFTRLYSLQNERNEIVRDLQKKLKQNKAYLDKNLARLIEMENHQTNEENANILMANLHQISVGVSSVELYDFYQDKTRVIKLKKDLTPQKNAENYYRKAKNEKIESESLQKNIARKEKEQTEMQKHLKIINQIDNVKELRKYLKDNHLTKAESSDSPEQHLFKKFLYQGWAIWVGKNAKNNDLLTQQYAHKEDLWLHAKDVSGSHVIIKHQSGRTFPTDVIEKAASLAAYYSKRSTDSLCPVIVTPRKFVRKTKDLAPGQVIVEKEEVIMVVPEKF